MIDTVRLSELRQALSGNAMVRDALVSVVELMIERCRQQLESVDAAHLLHVQGQISAYKDVMSILRDPVFKK